MYSHTLCWIRSIDGLSLLLLLLLLSHSPTHSTRSSAHSTCATLLSRHAHTLWLLLLLLLLLLVSLESLAAGYSCLTRLLLLVGHLLLLREGEERERGRERGETMITIIRFVSNDAQPFHSGPNASDRHVNTVNAP